MPNLFPLLLATHITLAISLFLPSILLPFALRTRRATVDSDNRVVHVLLWGQSHGTSLIGLGLALTGLGLVAVLGSTMLQQPWLMVALTIYFANLGDRLLRAAPEPAPARRGHGRGRRRGLEGARQAAALHLVPDGGPGGYHRVPDELEAGPVVSERGRARRPDCLFCRIVAGEIPSDRVHEDDQVIAFRDIAPRAPTHILVIPRAHIASAAELTEADGPLLGRLFGAAAQIAREQGIADAGYRLVTNVGRWGGQTVDHLHLHLMGGRPFDWPPG